MKSINKQNVKEYHLLFKNESESKKLETKDNEWDFILFQPEWRKLTSVLGHVVDDPLSSRVARLPCLVYSIKAEVSSPNV